MDGGGRSDGSRSSTYRPRGEGYPQAVPTGGDRAGPRARGLGCGHPVERDRHDGLVQAGDPPHSYEVRRSGPCVLRADDLGGTPPTPAERTCRPCGRRTTSGSPPGRRVRAKLVHRRPLRLRQRRLPERSLGHQQRSVRRQHMGCDPKEMWAPSVGFVGNRWVSFHAVRVQPISSSLPFGRFCIYTRRRRAARWGRSRRHGPAPSCARPPRPGRRRRPRGLFVDEETGRGLPDLAGAGEPERTAQRFYSRQLNSTGTGFTSGSTARELLVNKAGTWESTVIENPSMTYINGAYVLLYSGNAYPTTSYTTGYAVCSGPTGPCSRPSSSPLLKSVSGIWGPGGPRHRRSAGPVHSDVPLLEQLQPVCGTPGPAHGRVEGDRYRPERPVRHHPP